MLLNVLISYQVLSKYLRLVPLLFTILVAVLFDGFHKSIGKLRSTGLAPCGYAPFTGNYLITSCIDEANSCCSLRHH